MGECSNLTSQVAQQRDQVLDRSLLRPTLKAQPRNEKRRVKVKRYALVCLWGLLQVWAQQCVREHVPLDNDQKAVEPFRVSLLEREDVFAYQHNQGVVVLCDGRYRGATEIGTEARNVELRKKSAYRLHHLLVRRNVTSGFLRKLLESGDYCPDVAVRICFLCCDARGR